MPEFENRIYRFDKKLRIAQYAEHSIYDYKLKIAQAALYLQKLPDDFTQDDIEGYLSSLLDQKRYSIFSLSCSSHESKVQEKIHGTADRKTQGHRCSH